MVIEPCGHRILVRPFKAVEVDTSLAAAARLGIQLVRDNEKREDAGITKGLVLTIGPTAWQDFGSVPWCKVGDTVVYAKHSPFFIEDEDTKEVYGLLNDSDIIAVLSSCDFGDKQ